MTEPLKILLVEDNQLHCVQVQGLLVKECGIEVLLAMTLAEAKKLESEADAVILDIGLPDASREEVLAWMRECGRPIMVYTASVDGEDIQELVRAGALNVIGKGSHGDQIITGIRVVIAEHNLLCEERDRRERLGFILRSAFGEWMNRFDKEHACCHEPVGVS